MVHVHLEVTGFQSLGTFLRITLSSIYPAHDTFPGVLQGSKRWNDFGLVPPTTDLIQLQELTYVAVASTDSIIWVIRTARQ